MDTNDVATKAGGTGLALGEECALFPPPCELIKICPGDPLTAELLGEGVKLCGEIPYVLQVAAYAALEAAKAPAIAPAEAAALPEAAFLLFLCIFPRPPRGAVVRFLAVFDDSLLPSLKRLALLAFRTGVLPGLEGVSETLVFMASTPSVLITSIRSSPFKVSVLLAIERTLSGLLLKMSGEGVVDMIPVPVLGLFPKGSISRPLGGFFRFLLLLAFLACSIWSITAFFSACFAKTAIKRKQQFHLECFIHICKHIVRYMYYLLNCLHLVSISSSSSRSETISLGFKVSGLKSPPEITIF